MRSDGPWCNPLKWNFFGGGIKEGEKPLQACIREFEQEIGFCPSPVDFEFLDKFPYEEVGDVFLYKLNKRISWNDIRLGEGAGCGFFTISEMLKIDITNQSRFIIENYLVKLDRNFLG